MIETTYVPKYRKWLISVLETYKGATWMASEYVDKHPDEMSQEDRNALARRLDDAHKRRREQLEAENGK